MLIKQKGRYILDLNAEERKEFLKSFDMVLSDCDGVIWLMASPIPGAEDVINRFLQTGKKFKLISNNSMRTDDEYLKNLEVMGVQGIGNDDIVHPAKTITKYLLKHKPGQRVFCLGSEVFNEHLRRAGINIETLENRSDWTFPLLKKSLEPFQPVDAVVFDLGLNLNYAGIIHAQQHLKKNPNADFIVGATDENTSVTKDLIFIGPAGFIQLLKENTGKEPIVLGKPGPLLGKFLKEHFEIEDPKRAIFFGDALVQDIQFGISCGFQTLLMLSGATTKEEMLALPEEQKPDYYANGIGDLMKLFECVIWHMASPIQGAGEVINLFLQSGKKYKLISNNSMRSDDEYITNLLGMGVHDIKTDDIVHPVKTIVRYLQKYKPGQVVYSLGCDQFNDNLRNSGIEVQTLEPRNNWTFHLLTESLEQLEPVGAVVFDLSLNLSYASLVYAQQLLKRYPDTDFIVGATDENAPVTKDLCVLGSAGFIQMLRVNTGKEPIVLGKPGPLLGKFVKEHFQVKDPKRTIFFGDALVQDMNFGIACGFQTLLMLSGATTKKQMLALPEDQMPDYYANDIEDLKELFDYSSKIKVEQNGF